MMTMIGSVSMLDAAKGQTLTLKVTGQRRFALRTAVGLGLMRIAGAILPVGVVIDIEEDEGKPGARRVPPRGKKFGADGCGTARGA